MKQEKKNEIDTIGEGELAEANLSGQVEDNDNNNDDIFSQIRGQEGMNYESIAYNAQKKQKIDQQYGAEKGKNSMRVYNNFFFSILINLILLQQTTQNCHNKYL